MKNIKIGDFNLYVHQTKSPILDIRAYVHVGSFHESTPLEYGAVHYLEHLLFEGTLFNSSKDFFRRVSTLGNLDAGTSYDHTMYQFNTTSDNFDLACKYLLDMLFYPVLDYRSFEDERSIILEELSSYQDSSDEVLFEETVSRFWGSLGHCIVGSSQSISGMSYNTILNFYNRFYNINNMHFTIVGNVSISNIRRVFSSYLVPDKSKSTFIPTVIDPYRFFNPPMIKIPYEDNLSSVGFIFRGHSLTDDYNNKFIQRFLSHMMVNPNNSIDSILSNAIRGDNNLCYYIESFSNEFSFSSDLCFYAIISEDKSAQIIDIMLSTFNNIISKGFEDSLITQAKSNFLFSVKDRTQSSQGFADEYFNHLHIIPQFDYSYYEKCISSITSDDLMAYFKSIFPGSCSPVFTSSH